MFVYACLSECERGRTALGSCVPAAQEGANALDVETWLHTVCI